MLKTAELFNKKKRLILQHTRFFCQISFQLFVSSQFKKFQSFKNSCKFFFFQQLFYNVMSLLESLSYYHIFSSVIGWNTPFFDIFKHSLSFCINHLISSTFTKKIWSSENYPLTLQDNFPITQTWSQFKRKSILLESSIIQSNFSKLLFLLHVWQPAWIIDQSSFIRSLLFGNIFQQENQIFWHLLRWGMLTSLVHLCGWKIINQSITLGKNFKCKKPSTMWGQRGHHLFLFIIFNTIRQFTYFHVKSSGHPFLL